MWKDLTLKEKAEIMKMSVANGVTDINDIQQLYDDSIDNSVYAEGGHIYKNAGPLDKGKKKQQSINYHLNDAQSFIGELIAAGASPAQAAGVGGNVWVESRFNAAAENNINGGHWGLVQNDANIKKHIVKYYGDYSRASQMRFLKDGLTGQIKGAKQAPWLQRRFDDYRKHTKGVTDASIAAKYFHDDYEKSNNEGVADRMKAASVYQAQMNGVDMSKFVPQDYSDYASRTYQPVQMMTMGNSFKPITLSNTNTSSPWMDYLSKISQQPAVSFNTPIGPSNNLVSNNQINIGPVDFSNIGKTDELMSFVNPYTSKQALEYDLGLENNALWNSPYLLFNEHSAANGGHLYDTAGQMLIRSNAVNPVLQYVYGPEYEEVIRQRRNWRPSGRTNVQRSKPKYDIEARGDVTTNTVRPTQRVIRRKQTSESPARRAKEQQRYDAMMTQYRNERQGTISQAPNRLRHPDYDPVKANQVQQRYEQNEIAERNAYDRRALEHNILEGMEAIPWPSTIFGAYYNPNTHWYDPFSFFSNLYAKDNRGFFNYNQATRDFYDANPEVGSIANLIGDFIVPGAAAKVLKGVGKIPEVSRNLVASTAINYGTKTRSLPTNIYKLRKAFKSPEGKSIWDSDPFVEFINTKRDIPENTSFFFRMPKDANILNARNGAYRAKGSYYGPIISGGTVDGKFVSYGEPWMEFGTGPNSSWYEFPTSMNRGGRGPYMMATDWRGNKMDYDVTEAWRSMMLTQNPEFVAEEKAIDEALSSQKFNSTRERVQAYKEARTPFYEKWEYNPDIRTDIYAGNQTVIPNKLWHFNSEPGNRGFLSQPFWRYTQDPYSGAVQKELMMNWETPMKALDRTHADIIPFIDPETGTWDYLTSDVHISPDYSKFSFTTGDKTFDMKLFEDFLNGRIKSPTQVPKLVPTKNIPKNSTFKIDTDKRLKLSLGSPSRILATDIGKLTEAEVEAMFGPRAVYWKKMYDVAKNHNFEGKFKAIGEQAEREIRSRFSINREDPDIKTAIDKAKRLYDIPEYKARFERFGTLGDTFIDDALNRIKNIELQGVSEDYKIIGQHGVEGGASAEAHPVSPKVTIKDSDSSRAIQELTQHEVNHAAHGMKYQPEWMKYHNERIRPKPRRESSTPGAKYMNEMDEIVERAKTTVEWADRIRKPGESLNDVLSRIVDDFENLDGFEFAKKYKDIPGDTKSYLLFFEPKTGKKFLQNFVGSFIVGTTGMSIVNQ